MNKKLILWGILLVFSLHQCKVIKEAQRPGAPVVEGMEGFRLKCDPRDTIQSILIKKAEALMMFDEERYEVTASLYSIKDSLIYLSAVNSGYEILRACVYKDSIRVIDRLNRIVYRTDLKRQFGYQYPVDFIDLQNLISVHYCCDYQEYASDDMESLLKFEFDDKYVKKRMNLDRKSFKLKLFEFYHQKTGKYLMGEGADGVLKIYSNFMITEFEVHAQGGTVMYNQTIPVKMKVNPRKYTFTELR